MRYSTVPTNAVYQLTGNELKVFMIMIDQWAVMGESEGINKGWYFRSMDNLMEDTGLSRATLNKCINSLVNKRFISKRKSKRVDNANYYQLHTSLWDWSDVQKEKQPKSQPNKEFGHINSLNEDNIKDLWVFNRLI